MIPVPCSGLLCCVEEPKSSELFRHVVALCPSSWLPLCEDSDIDNIFYSWQVEKIISSSAAFCLL